MRAFSGYLQDLWQGRSSNLVGRLLLIWLYLPSVVYGSIMRVRAWCYRHGIFRVYHLPRSVISVGNLTVGGTGKTPVTAWVARYLLGQGLRVAVLSRGYGGACEGQLAIVSDGDSLLLTAVQCGDEPYLLASSIPGLVVVIGSDRYQAGLLAMEQLRPDVFLLDDGYQHLRLHRDLNILLMDASKPLGNGRILPAGPLREPVAAHSRADLLIYTRSKAGQTPGWSPGSALPVCAVGYRLSTFVRLDTGEAVSPDQLSKERVLAFAGIADPTAFFGNLRQCDIQPIETVALPDHEGYAAATLQKLEDLVDHARIDWLVTTEKDGVKLLELTSVWRSKIVTAQLELVFDDDTLLKQAVHTAFKQSGGVV